MGVLQLFCLLAKRHDSRVIRKVIGYNLLSNYQSVSQSLLKKKRQIAEKMKSRAEGFLMDGIKMNEYNNNAKRMCVCL